MASAFLTRQPEREGADSPCRHYPGSALFLVINPNTYLTFQSYRAPRPCHRPCHSPRLTAPRKLSHPPCPTLLPHLDSHSCPPSPQSCLSSPPSRTRYLGPLACFVPASESRPSSHGCSTDHSSGASPRPLSIPVPSTGPQQAVLTPGF